jgi:hypothetical protein
MKKAKILRSRDLEISNAFIYFYDIINEYYEYYYEYYELLYVIFIIFVFGPPTLSGKIHHYRQKNAKKATLEIVFSCILSIFNNFEGSYLKNDGSKPISNCIKNSQIEIVTSSST